MDSWGGVIGAWALTALMLGVGWGMAAAPGWDVPRGRRVVIAAVVLALAAAGAVLIVRLADGVLAWPAASEPALDAWISGRAQGISNMLIVCAALAVVATLLWAAAWAAPTEAERAARAAVPQEEVEQGEAQATEQGGHWGGPAGQATAASQVQAFAEDLRW